MARIFDRTFKGKLIVFVPNFMIPLCPVSWSQEIGQGVKVYSAG